MGILILQLDDFRSKFIGQIFNFGHQMVIFGTKFILENELKSYPEKVRKLRTFIAYQFSFDVSQLFRFGAISKGSFWGCSFGSRFGSCKLGAVNENARIETVFGNPAKDKSQACEKDKCNLHDVVLDWSKKLTFGGFYILFWHCTKY